MSTRSMRLEARISPEGLAIVKRAAEIQGRSVSDFVVAAAQEVATKTITDMEIMRLSLEDHRAFTKAMLNPPKAGPALQRAKAAHRRLIVQSQ